METIRNIWRSSHFLLAAFSAIFVLLVTVSGIVLALEPIHTEYKKPYRANLNEISIATLLNGLEQNKNDVLEVNISNKGFIEAITFDGASLIHPKSGETLSETYKRPAFFKTATNFHRSLFLKAPGRFFVGIVSFLLVLIATTGFLLMVKKLGWKKLFLPFEKTDKHQYYHTYFGRISLIPILIIAFTGVILSLVRFSVIDVDTLTSSTVEIKTTPLQKFTWPDFEVFQNTPLVEVEKIEFPFTTDDKDYFRLYLKDSRLLIHQKTGAILEQENYPFSKAAATLSFNLHTGTSSVFWSVILLISSCSILYFMYSGFLISYARLFANKTKNSVKYYDAELVILVGSENGKTKQFSKVLYDALIEQNTKVYIDELNNYRKFPKLTEVIIMASTYGEGEAPANGSRFLELVDTIDQPNTVKYNVLGFGSVTYPKFCQFAVDVEEKLATSARFIAETPPTYVNKNNFATFKNWSEHWSEKKGFHLNLPESLVLKKEKAYRFSVVQRTVVNDGFSETLNLELTSIKSKKILAGDLISIEEKRWKEERLYSVGRSLNGNLLLSVKKHSKGLCSNFLYNLNLNESFEGKHNINTKFHFPIHAPTVIMIANGTGIAPFIGMLNIESLGTKELFWGNRTQKSIVPFQQEIDNSLKSAKLSKFIFALSKEESEFSYVQEIVQQKAAAIAIDLDKGAVIMLCGSLAMNRSVLEVIGQSTLKFSQRPLSFYKNKHQILSDCY